MQAEILYFAWSVLAGGLMALGGAGMEWLHHRHRRRLWLSVLDLLYWYMLGVGLFLLCYHRNSGVLRGYAMLGNLLGYMGVRLLGRWWEKGIARRKKTE